MSWGRNGQVSQQDGRSQERAEGRRLPKERRGNAEVAEGEGTEETHETGPEVKRQGDQHGRNYCVGRTNQSKE